MKRYKMKVPRVAIALVAVAMAALTLVATVVLPVPTASCEAEAPVAASNIVAPEEVAISPGYIEIVSARERIEPTNASARVDMVAFRR